MRRIPWDLLALALLAALPFIPGVIDTVDATLKVSFGSELTTLFIMAILAYGLNVVVGYTGLLQLGIGAFFAIGAYTTGILVTTSYPFQWNFALAMAVAMAASAAVGILLAAPTLRLRGDYLALVTLGFGEVVRFALRNLDEITNGTKGINPIPAPVIPGIEGDWSVDYRYFYYLCLGMLILVVLGLRNLEHSRIGRAWIALREDELAATCMGLNVGRLKLGAFALGSGLAGLAGSLYSLKLGNTADPDAYGFNRSIITLSCLILGGLGSRPGVLLGVFLVLGFDNIFAPAMDKFLQGLRPPGTEVQDYMTFSFWRLMVFGLVLILVMRFRPEGLWPSRRELAQLPAPTAGKGA
ncbi:MAG: branched-chain amino acid ABC transporter permease [Gemmataceae bacterium]